MALTRIPFERINREVSLMRLANDRYKLNWPDYGKPVQVRCPLHDDSTPSARYYSDEKGGWCWTCQAVIDPVSLTAAMEHTGKAQAARLLMEWFAIPEEAPTDADDVWELIRQAEGGDVPLTDHELEGMRRAAGLAVRLVGHEWDPEMLSWWDILDHDGIDPREWVVAVRQSVHLQ